MNAFWNSLYLERPPYSTWCIASDAKDANLNINLDLFKSVLNTAISDLNSNIIYTEAAALSRLIYRMKSKFRNDKGLRCMAQLNKALTNCFNMSLHKEYETLLSVIEVETDKCTLPSKQMLEYVLVRTQGYAKLMCRIEEIAQHACHFLKARMALGHAWVNALLAFATVSRIGYSSKLMLQECCKWYNGLYHYSEKFKYVGVPWIPKDENLPSNLKLWLSSDWLNVETSHDMASQKRFAPFPSDNISVMDDVASNNSKTDTSRLPQEDTLIDGIFKKESTIHDPDTNDIGEMVDRETFKKSLPKASHTEIPLAKKRKYMHSNAGTIKQQWKVKKSKKNKRMNEVK